jgi:hypothetical protein
LVEHHLAMVRVAGSNPVFRSLAAFCGASGTAGGMAEWLGKGLQNPVPRFDSGCRLSEGRRPARKRAISSGGERFLDAEEVSGSNPLSPTHNKAVVCRENSMIDRRPQNLSGAIVRQPCSNPSKYAERAIYRETCC